MSQGAAAGLNDGHEAEWEVEATACWVLERGFQRVALQLPDELLPACPRLVAALQHRLGPSARVYVLADTTYNPLGVDEVAAQHMSAECVIHYGHASLAPVMALPAFFVLPRHPLDCTAAAAALCHSMQQALAEATSAEPLLAAVVLVDQAYQHLLPQLRAELQARGSLPLVFAEAAARSLEPPHAAEAHAGAAASSPPAQTVAEAGCQSESCCRAGGDTAPAAATAASPHELPPTTRCGDAEDGGRGASVTEASEGTSSTTAEAAVSDATAADARQPTGPGSSGREEGGPGAEEVSSSTAAGTPAAPNDSRPGNAAPAAAEEPSTAAAAGPVHLPPSAPAAVTPCGQACSGGGLRWTLPAGVHESRCLLLWLGPLDSPALRVLQLTRSRVPWRAYDPRDGGTHSVGVLPDTARLLKRRYFLVEKARAASIVGILVGTVSTAGFVVVVERMRRLAQSAGKKTYTLLMGKPSPAKLANFPEVDVFVMVADPQGFLLDSRDYLAPVVTPFEAELAFTGLSLSPDYYSLDFDYRREGFRAEGSEEEWEGRGSGVTSQQQLQLSNVLGAQHLSARGEGGRGATAVAIRNAADYLVHIRTHQGLESPLTGAEHVEAAMAVAGRSGRAAGYSDEPAGVVAGGGGDGAAADAQA